MSLAKLLSRKPPFSRSFCFNMVAFALILTSCASAPQQVSPTSTPAPSSPNSQQASNSSIVALPIYQVSVFAFSTSSYSHPDPVAVDGNNAFICYQNFTLKDGSDHKTSTVVEYTMDGRVVKMFNVPGHCDGMRVDPSTHLLWVVSNETANPTLVTIDPTNGKINPYTFPRAPHGGGYDDVYFLNGMAFISASNPTLDNNGINAFPAIDKITLNSGKVLLTPVLMGNAVATDTVSNTQVTLNETDPDSLSTDTRGDLVLIGQHEIVYLHNPSTPQQHVSSTSVGTRLDETVWITSAHGRLLVVERMTGQTYWIRSTFNVGSVYTEAGFESSIGEFVGQLDPSTGNAVPIAIGFIDPSGLVFVPDGSS